MTKFCVKKPFYVLVAAIIVIIIGFVSLSKMQTDLMPEVSLNYLMVVATEVGASAEKVEEDVCKPLENKLGTISGLKNITSTASDNYGLVSLEFTDETDMDSALVRVSMALDSLDLADGVTTPTLMEIGMDMMATMYATVSYEGKDIKQVSSFTVDEVIPYLSRQDGVASISSIGLIEETLQVVLNEDKINEINDKVLGKANKSLNEAKEEIDKAKRELEDAERELEDGKSELENAQKDANKQIADGIVQLDSALAMQQAYDASYNSAVAAQMALQQKNVILEENYAKIMSQFTQGAAMMGVTLPEKLADFNPDDPTVSGFITAALTQGLMMAGQDQATIAATIAQTQDGLKTLKTEYTDTATELKNLEVEIAGIKAAKDMVASQISGLSSTQSELISSGLVASSTFGATQAQLTSGEASIKQGKTQLEDAEKNFNKARETALKNANLDAMLSLDTLSQLIYAQNFSMPAGYIDDENDNQWLLEVGNEFDSIESLENLVLADIEDIGEIKLSDVADIIKIDNIGKAYSKVNGQDAVMLSISKASTASTSTVSKNLEKAMAELEEKYEGLSLTALMDQGDYIDIIVNAVFSSLLLGALLAVIVLALFLKEIKPTLIVAFSIPFSVLFSLIIMYFADMTLNIMTLGGLCIAIGMLVDNSIVVMENIYRLIGKGVPAPQAAVQGTKQVAGSIIASTITTICVFLPMVYTSGVVAQLLVPFCFTVSYALMASLLVALTVVPTLGSVLFKKKKEIHYPFFEKVQNAYGKLLSFFLKVKIIPLGIAIALLVLCLFRAFSTGLVLLDDMTSNQISVSFTIPDDFSREEAYELADKVSERILTVDGIDKVGMMDGGIGSILGMGTNNDDNYKSISVSVLTDKDITATKDFERITSDIEAALSDLDADCKVTSSALGETDALLGSGIEITVYGEDEEVLIKIASDLASIVEKYDGVEEVDTGIADDSKKLHINIDKDEAARKGFTVATIFMEINKHLTTEKTAMNVTMDDSDMDVVLVDERNLLTYENLMDMELETTTKNKDGEDETKIYHLSDFATLSTSPNVNSIRRINQGRYMSVTATVGSDVNPTLLSRDILEEVEAYDTPSGYRVSMGGEYDSVMDMMKQMLLAILLGFVLIYLVMVAQFQSLLSPFIIIFTVPLAFTGGMLGLMLTGNNISALSMMGFMILMGTVVNNGIVFVDYTNQLRMQGVAKRVALVATGKTRMRPILMTALTTILSMSVMVFSPDAGNAMQKPMAIVVVGGLIYSTLMTLFIVPVLYDILYRKQPKVIDVGDEIDDEIDDVSELLNISEV